MGGGLIEIVKFEKRQNIKIIDVAVSSIPSAVGTYLLIGLINAT